MEVRLRIPNNIEGMRFAFGGISPWHWRMETTIFIKMMGGYMSGTINSKVDYLLAESLDGAKVAKAYELRIPILNRRDFLWLCGIPGCLDIVDVTHLGLGDVGRRA